VAELSTEYKPTGQEVQEDHKDTRNITFKLTWAIKFLIWNNFTAK